LSIVFSIGVSLAFFVRNGLPARYIRRYSVTQRM
jgi:hypothetical protein